MRSFLALALSLVVLALPAAAVSQGTPANDVYGNVDVKQQESASSSSLPFGGRDVAFVVLAGAALLGTGVAVRRAVRSD